MCKTPLAKSAGAELLSCAAHSFPSASDDHFWTVHVYVAACKQCLLLPFWHCSYTHWDTSTFSFVLQWLRWCLLPPLFGHACVWILSAFSLGLVHVAMKPGNSARLATVSWQRKAVKRLELRVCCSSLTKRNVLHVQATFNWKSQCKGKKNKNNNNKSLSHKSTSSNPTSHTRPFPSLQRIIMEISIINSHKITCVKKELSDHPL